jgi:hypothetical protein
MNDYSKFEKEEQALADYFGEGNFKPFYKKHLKQGKLKISLNDFIAGDIDTMFTAIKKLGINYEYNDYPKCLNKYLHRKIWESSIKDIKEELFNKCTINPIFIKPKDKLKKFTGFLIKSIDDLNKINNAGNDIKIFCSEPVNFVSEYRCPVINGEIKDFCHYSGDSDINIDKSLVQNMVKDFVNSPKAYCIDVGVLSNGETALIEINDAFSIGKYNMSNDVYAELLITRWNEIKGYKCKDKSSI